MPSNNERRNEDSAWRNITRRLERLERKTKTPERSKEEEIAVFAVIGDMEVSTSPGYPVRRGGQVVTVNFISDGGATGDTEFDILVDGSAVGSTVTIAQADDDDEAYIGDVRVAAGSKMKIDLTQAGMHEGAVIQVVMKG